MARVSQRLSNASASVPSKNPVRRLHDIVDEIGKIKAYTRRVSKTSFLAEDELAAMRRDAVERCLLRISEAAKKLRGQVDKHEPEIPWERVRGLGDMLRHEYDVINRETIWQVVVDHLPPLRDACQRLIKLFEEQHAAQKRGSAPRKR
ncbi:MAG: DUF86 domain-containing protein [Proteobacteria bacterium]|nr:DUF86 domain-containing protein [Pseudomonadota bacterium]